MDEEIAIEVRQALIEQRIALWRNTAFQSTVDLRVASRFGDADLIAAAKATITRAEKMIAGYEEELKTLLNGQVAP